MTFPLLSFFLHLFLYFFLYPFVPSIILFQLVFNFKFLLFDENIENEIIKSPQEPFRIDYFLYIVDKTITTL